jgi:hypothetical protein
LDERAEFDLAFACIRSIVNSRQTERLAGAVTSEISYWCNELGTSASVILIGLIGSLRDLGRELAGERMYDRGTSHVRVDVTSDNGHSVVTRSTRST